MKVYQALAQKMKALYNCRKYGNQEWAEKHEAAIKKLMEDAPHGSGFNSGTHLEDDDKHLQQAETKIVFYTDYEHMNDVGMYTGWTHHTITITPRLDPSGFDYRISGKNKAGIKDYMGDVFQSWLDSEVPEIREAQTEEAQTEEVRGAK